MLKKVGSWPHNPLIASSFFRSGQIEAWGREIEKMKSGCISDNLPEPEFDILPGVFIICFHIRDYSKNGSVTKHDFGVNFGVNETKQKVMELMLKNPQIKIQEIAEELNLTKRNIEYAIRALKKEKLVERIGADKNGHWAVKPGSENEI
jgi:ATP-dependent DNA helicase RecG